MLSFDPEKRPSPEEILDLLSEKPLNSIPLSTSTFTFDHNVNDYNNNSNDKIEISNFTSPGIKMTNFKRPTPPYQQADIHSELRAPTEFARRALGGDE